MSGQPASLVTFASYGSILVATIEAAQMRDFNLVQEIKGALIKGITEGKPRQVVLDLRNLEFIGSVGFLAFLAARRLPGVEKIILCEMRDNVRDTFSLCRLVSENPGDQVPFIARQTVESALASLSVC